MKTLLLLLSLLVLAAGCTVGPTSCHGPVFALNPGDWTPIPADLNIGATPELKP